MKNSELPFKQLFKVRFTSWSVPGGSERPHTAQIGKESKSFICDDEGYTYVITEYIKALEWMFGIDNIQSIENLGRAYEVTK